MAKTHYLYSIFDLLTGEYGPVLEFATNDAAVRSVKNFIKSRPDSPIALNPENFKFQLLGSFDTETGKIHAEFVDLTDRLLEVQ